MAVKQTFIKGALILAAANVIVKLVGAFYTIPLARLIGAEGMGLYSSAYQIYLWLFIISTTGIPIAISKMVSEAAAVGNLREAHRIFKVSFILLVILGICSSFILYFGANLFANAIGTAKAYLSLVAISPCLFFVALMSAYRGYFQGMQNMVPTAVSGLVEAVTRAVLGLVFAYAFVDMGMEYSSAGAVMGVSLGGFAGLLLLVVIYYSYRKRIFRRIEKSGNTAKGHSASWIAVNLVKVAAPITLGASVFTVASVIDLAMIMRRLKDIGFSETYAISLYGYLTGYAYKVYSLPVTVIAALAISIVPVVAGAFANRSRAAVIKTVDTGFRVAMIFALPAAVGIGVLASPILKLLFNDTSAYQMLTILSAAIIFVSTVQVSNSILQSVGRVMIPVKNLLIGAVVKIFANYLLIGIPAINILGAPIGTGICFLVVTVLNFRDIKRILNIKYNISEMLLKPLIAACAMGFLVLYCYNVFFGLWHRNSLATLAAIFAGTISYMIFLLLIGGLKKSDLEMMPFGEGLSKYLQRLGFLRL